MGKWFRAVYNKIASYGVVVFELQCVLNTSGRVLGRPF